MVPLFDLHRLLDEEARGRALGDEGEGTVGIDGDLRRNRHALFKAVGRGVERLADYG